MPYFCTFNISPYQGLFLERPRNSSPVLRCHWLAQSRGTLSTQTLQCPSLAHAHNWPLARADPRFLEKGVHMFKGVGVGLADFIYLYLISNENEIIWSH